MKYHESVGEFGCGHAKGSFTRRLPGAAPASRPAPGTRWSLLLAALGLMLLAGPVSAADSAQVKKLLANPPREYTSAPLWVWNDLLTEEQIRGTLRDLAGQNVKQVFIHPRPGLMTPYLSADWFRLWKVALKEAGKLDMNIWIYDENSYPSGFAGGWVPELMPESRGLGLNLREAKTAPKWETNTLAVFRLDGDKSENLSRQVKAGEKLPDGRWLVASVQRAGNSPWHGNRCYVNLLTPGVTEKFLEVTLGAYQREIGAHFGQRVPGVFTDEPQLLPAGGYPWCDDLPQQFEKRWGYSLIENLASLTREAGDWKKVRHNYFQTVLELFIERWAKPYYEYCEKHHLEFTGHYWEHEWPNCLMVPDNMAMSAWQQRPGIDILMNQYAENTHAQFGNVRSCREISSLANQLGRKRTLVELYGAGGWDLRFEDMKRIGDWLQVLGVNTMDEHLSYITLRGARKRDHPQSFSYHEPWWRAYHVSATYLARLSAVLSQGEQINPVLVLEPTSTAWLYQGNPAKLKEIGDSFFNLLMTLERAQVEYDLAAEEVIATHGTVTNTGDGSCLRIGNRSYALAILPPNLENLNGPTVDRLEALSKNKGTVWHYRDLPLRVNGGLSDRVDRLAKSSALWRKVESDEAFTTPKWLDSMRRLTGVNIHRQAGDKGILFHHRRQLSDGQILFLANTSIEFPSAGEIESELNGIERWNLQSGKVEPYPFVKTGQGVKASFNLAPSGSLLLFLSKKTLPSAPSFFAATTQLPASGPLEIRRLGPNVLTLDYADITAGGETKSNLYFYQANQFAWQKNGMERDPWDSAVQFKDELITKKFPGDSGFTASYRFTLEGAVPKNLAIVIERPDLYAITCNGKSVTAKPGDWWLDQAFGKIKIAAAACLGENTVTLQASPFTMFHELEPAYVLGDFWLKPGAKGFIMAPDQPMRLAGWNEQGHPFYAQGVGYRQKFNVSKASGQFVVRLPKWLGSVAEVKVNEKSAGYITAPPWECEVTSLIKRGENTLEVMVIGTLKNTLGPHHGRQPLGSAWPGMFQRGPNPGPPPGAEYSTVGYGLFETFELEQSVRR